MAKTPTATAILKKNGPPPSKAKDRHHKRLLVCLMQVSLDIELA